MTDAVLTCPQCSSEFPIHPDKPQRFCWECRFPLMKVAGKYELEKKLAEGGFGMLYLARHTALDKRALRAIKIFKPDLFQQEHMHERFMREVRVTAALSEENPHIVRIYDDFGHEPGLGYYYVMEFLRGQTLQERMVEQKRLGLPLVFSIFYQLCRAMRAAHDEGIVHRDLKPDNIFLIQREGSDSFVKVIDFGIAKLVEGATQANLTKGVLGTPAYMAPEQCLGQDIDQRTDIYAMGIILYELLAGRTPFIAPSQEQLLSLLHAHISEPPPPLEDLGPSDLPEGLEAIVRKALAKSPNQRFESVGAFWNALVPFAPSGSRVAPFSDADGFLSTADFEDEQHAEQEAMAMAPTMGPADGLLGEVSLPSAEFVVSGSSGVGASSSSVEGGIVPEPKKSIHLMRWVGLAFLLLAVTAGGTWALMRMKTNAPKAPERRLVSATSPINDAGQHMPPTHPYQPPDVPPVQPPVVVPPTERRGVFVRPRRRRRYVRRRRHRRLGGKRLAVSPSGMRQVIPGVDMQKQIKRLRRNTKRAMRKRRWHRGNDTSRNVVWWLWQLCRLLKQSGAPVTELQKARKRLFSAWRKSNHAMSERDRRRLLPKVAVQAFAYGRIRHRRYVAMPIVGRGRAFKRSFKRKLRAKREVVYLFKMIERVRFDKMSACSLLFQGMAHEHWAQTIQRILFALQGQTNGLLRLRNRVAGFRLRMTQLQPAVRKARQSYRRLLSQYQHVSSPCVRKAKNRLNRLQGAGASRPF